MRLCRRPVGKGFAFRRDIILAEAAPRSGGVASKQLRACLRQGEALQHGAAAKPLAYDALSSLHSKKTTLPLLTKKRKARQRFEIVLNSTALFELNPQVY